jgi:hypothetical protein
MKIGLQERRGQGEEGARNNFVDMEIWTQP